MNRFFLNDIFLCNRVIHQSFDWISVLTRIFIRKTGEPWHKDDTISRKNYQRILIHYIISNAKHAVYLLINIHWSLDCVREVLHLNDILTFKCNFSSNSFKISSSLAIKTKNNVSNLKQTLTRLGPPSELMISSSNSGSIIV